MQSNAWLMLVAGVIAILVGLLADRIGLGTQPGMGWLQIILAVVGVVLVIAGLAMRGRSSGPTS